MGASRSGTAMANMLAQFSDPASAFKRALADAGTVEQHPDGIDLDDTPDPYAVLPAHRPPTGYRPPFRMVVGRRSILFYVNHVIGDVMVITQLTSQLAQGNFVGLIAGASFGPPMARPVK